MLWYLAAMLACLLGTATKEILVTAPLLVLLYDRTFMAGSLFNALRRRWALYVGLASSWGLLVYLILSTGLIARQQEIGAPSWLGYLGSQPGVILHYLRLSFWPSRLCMSYEWPVAGTLWSVLPSAIIVGLLLGATVWGLAAHKAWGFLGAWFFLILAPTSSIVALNQLAHEHRMYLSLASLCVLAVTAGYTLWGRLPRQPDRFCYRLGSLKWAVPLVVLVLVLAALGHATVLRNSLYNSPVAIWKDGVEKSPHNAMAHNNLGMALADSGRTDEAIRHYREAVRVNPDLAQAHSNLGLALATVGKPNEAIEACQNAVRLRPDYPVFHDNYAKVLADAGRCDEAIEEYRQAVRLKPDYAASHYGLGNALSAAGRIVDAIEQYREALRIEPDYVDAYNNLGVALIVAGRPAEAIGSLKGALHLAPNRAEAHNNLGLALAGIGSFTEAAQNYREAIHQNPEFVEAYTNLANALLAEGKTAEAIEHYTEVTHRRPNGAEGYYNLGLALAAAGRSKEGIEHLTRALQLKPDFGPAREQLAHLLANMGTSNSSIEQCNLLLQLMPDSPAAMNNLAWVLATTAPTGRDNALRAIRLAERARALAGADNAQCLDTLAAAYAATGRFSEAIETAQQAVRLAESAGQSDLAKNIQARLQLYRAGKPYRKITAR